MLTLLPVCLGGRCEKAGIQECEYDVAEKGITRMQNLQQNLQAQNEQYDRLKGLLDVMQGGSDFQATTILAEIRMGRDVEDLAASWSSGKLFPVEPLSGYVLAAYGSNGALQTYSQLI